VKVLSFTLGKHRSLKGFNNSFKIVEGFEQEQINFFLTFISPVLFCLNFFF
jgi:hypothetical protein